MAVAKRLDRASQDLARVKRAAQRQHERRDGKGRSERVKGGQPKILLNARAKRAENTAARGNRLAQKLEAEAQSRKDSARAALHILPELGMETDTALIHGRLLHLEDVLFQRGAFRLGPLDFEVRDGERVAVAGPP